MDIERDVTWQLLPAGHDLDCLIAVRAGWQLVRQPCAGGRACKTHMFALYDPNDQWSNDMFVHVRESDEEAICLLWQSTPETHFSTDLRAAWSLLLQSAMTDVSISTNIVEEEGQAEPVVEVILADSGENSAGEEEDYFYEGRAPLDQPALALMRAWLAWHDARCAGEPVFA